MTYFTSYLHLVDILFIEIGENQPEQVSLQACRPTTLSAGKSCPSSSSRIYIPIGPVEKPAHSIAGQLLVASQAKVVGGC